MGLKMLRITYSEYLQQQGREDLEYYSCFCGRVRSSNQLFDVRADDDVAGYFVCDVCLSHKLRCEDAEQRAQQPWPNEEQLNDLRARRNQLLAMTDHTQLPDYPISEELREQYRTWRQSVRDVVTSAKSGIRVEFQPPPTQE